MSVIDWPITAFHEGQLPFADSQRGCDARSDSFFGGRKALRE